MPADGRTATFPELQPVMVAGEDEVQALVRTARAGIANLSLQLRSARQAERLAEAPVAEDLEAAREFFLGTIDRQVDARRTELTAELDRARADAADVVAAARTDAAAIVAAASADSLQTLLAGSQGQSGPPSLRVVGEPLPPPAVPDRLIAPIVLDPPTAPGRPRFTTLPVVPAVITAPVASVEREPVVAFDAPDGPSASIERDAPELLLESLVPDAPCVPTSPDALVGSPEAPPSDPAGLPEVIADAVRSAVSKAVREAVADSAPAPADGPAPVVSPLARPTRLAATTSVPATVISTEEGRSGLKRFLYLDVLLPMIAVLVVIVVLLAWIG